MKLLYFLPPVLFCCLTLSSFAQGWLTPTCPSPPPPGAESCVNTCVYCDIDGYMGINDGIPSGGSLLCGQISVHNDQWFAFFAGSSTIEFTIETSNCAQGDGLQVAILESCDQDALACNPGMESGGGMPLQVSYNQFIPGHTYYLMLDGWSGDVCNYQITVSSGTTTGPVIGAVSPIQGPSQVCPGAQVVYEVPPVSNAGYYHWTAPPDASINGGSNDIIVPATASNTVTITFGQFSGQVCVSAGNSCTPATPATCRNVVNQPLPLTVLPPVTILFDETPYSWADGIYILSTPGVFNVQATLTSWLGCDSIIKQQVTILPAGEGYITGTIFWDSNDNGFKEPGEPVYTGGAVVQSSSGALTSSHMQDGTFVFIAQNPGDTIRAVAPQPGLTVKPAFRTVQTGIWNGYDFGLFPVPEEFDLKVNLFPSVLRPGFETTVTLVCKNQGLAAVAGVALSCNLPLNTLEFLDALPNPFSVVGNTIEWQLGTMAAGEVRNVVLHVKTPVATPLGTNVQFDATITPVLNDIAPVNNFTSTTKQVVGSYDPNDKSVEPAFVTPALLKNGQPFQYTIRFQNTGNYPAEFVRIIDTLAETVDPASFQFVASSHPCTWKVRGAGVIEFLFQNIHLPDSSSNEPGSHGFAAFTVKPKSDLALGTVIRNFCDIYFDYNAPVRTNAAGTQVVYFVPGEGLAAQDALIVRPNPAAFFALCDWQTPAPADGSVRLFDLTGLPRLEMPVAQGQTSVHLDLGALPPGLYFVVLEAGNLILTNKLVVVALTPVGWN